MKQILLFAALACLIGCTSRSKTEKTLEGLGFTNIEAGGYAIFSCSKDDIQRTKFKAINHNGVSVEGAVCCGMILKNCTVRF